MLSTAHDAPHSVPLTRAASPVEPVPPHGSGMVTGHLVVNFAASGKRTLSPHRLEAKAAPPVSQDRRRFCVLPYDPNERRMVGRVYSSKSASGSVSKEHHVSTGPSEEETRTSS